MSYTAMKLVDSHAHLDELEELGKDLQEARAAGVGAIVAVGQGVGSNLRTLEIAERHRGYVFPALGFHPWRYLEEDADENIAFLRERARDCVAFGEVGLDYKVKVKKRVQWEIFGRILDLALEFDKPLLLHTRYSWKRAFEMARERGVKRAVFHWYSGPLPIAEKILEEGYLLSATPALMYSPPHREAVKAFPLERLLLETDTPVRYGEFDSRPKHLRVTLREAAKLRGVPEEEIAERTTENALRFFGIRI